VYGSTLADLEARLDPLVTGSPLGDAVLCTPALRAIRKHYSQADVTLAARADVQTILEGCGLADEWLDPTGLGPRAAARTLAGEGFTTAILFKNSLGSALAVYLASIPSRIGYARDGRGPLLTERLRPPKKGLFRYRPVPMADYYLAIASWLGCDTSDRRVVLAVGSGDTARLHASVAELNNRDGPLVVLVPGGQFGPSKCWPADRFAAVADRLVERYRATVVVSVSPSPAERAIAERLCRACRFPPVNLGEIPLDCGRLKALLSEADLVICNDTGPRHVAIAFERKVITLFGPNDPAWTDSGYDREVQLRGFAPCAPCSKSTCRKSRLYCMESIGVETVWQAARAMLDGQEATAASRRALTRTRRGFAVDEDFRDRLAKTGMESIEGVFAFRAGKPLAKDNLAPHRQRIRFETDGPEATLFLKRYERPPRLLQVRNWLAARRRVSCGVAEANAAEALAAIGINTPRTVCCGEKWGILFENRSFIITEKIPAAESLERKLPAYLEAGTAEPNFERRRDFITRLATLVRTMHEAGLCHRDLYFSHVFLDESGVFFLIDLARVFRPLLLRRRYRIKDVAQLCYSAPASSFTSQDRLRFYLAMTGRRRLEGPDKKFIRKVLKKTARMARHDERRGRPAGYVPGAAVAS
jgi:heptosyltransferase-2